MMKLSLVLNMDVIFLQIFTCPNINYMLSLLRTPNKRTYSQPAIFVDCFAVQFWTTFTNIQCL